MEESTANREITRVNIEIVKLVKSLDEKAENESHFKSLILELFYLLGIASSCLVAIFYNEIANKYISDRDREVFVLCAGVLTALFFLTLLIRKMSNSRYYNVILKRKEQLIKLNKGLLKIREYDDNYVKMIDNPKANLKIQPADDVEETIREIQNQVGNLRKRQSVVIDGLLNGVFCLAAIAVGGVIMLMAKDMIFSIVRSILSFAISNEEICSVLVNIVVVVGTFGGAVFGPMLVKFFYYDNVLEKKLVNGLIPWVFLSSIVVCALFLVFALVILCLIGFVFGFIAGVFHFILKNLVGIIIIGFIGWWIYVEFIE